MKSVSIAITAAALAQVAPVDAFVPSSLNHQSRMSSSTTAMRSTVMPLPTAENLRKQQPELDEGDLYMTPPNTMQDPPRAGAVMKMLPKETWDIDTPTSLFYFAVDLLAVVSTMGFLDMVVTSDNYHAFPMWAQALAVAPLQILTGFAMW
jgi:L-fucose mutarotase/ribose pyranase (RbsD/FucU family)